MEKCKQREFGKIVGYEVNNNTVKINFHRESVFIKVVNSYIINFFVPLFREERNSKAVENLKIIILILTLKI